MSGSPRTPRAGDLVGGHRVMSTRTIAPGVVELLLFMPADTAATGSLPADLGPVDTRTTTRTPRPSGAVLGPQNRTPVRDTP